MFFLHLEVQDKVEQLEKFTATVLTMAKKLESESK